MLSCLKNKMCMKEQTETKAKDKCKSSYYEVAKGIDCTCKWKVEGKLDSSYNHVHIYHGYPLIVDGLYAWYRVIQRGTL